VSYRTTSKMRVALCSHIVNHVRDSTPEWKAWLAERLDALPFESMSDAALIAMAREVLPCDTVTAIVEHFPAERYEIRERGALCRVCNDTHIVGDDLNGYSRCPNCNPAPEPTERTHP